MNMPSEKYKVIINKKEPSDEEINQYKDFDRILDRFERRHKREPLHQVLFRINRLAPIILLAILAALLLLFYWQNQQPRKETPQPEKQEPTAAIATTYTAEPLWVVPKY